MRASLADRESEESTNLQNGKNEPLAGSCVYSPHNCFSLVR